MLNFPVGHEQVFIESVNQELLQKASSKNFIEKIIYSKKTRYQKLSVFDNSKGRFLCFEDLPQAGIINSDIYSGNIPYINYFFLSLLLNPEIKNVLMLGMGSGLFAMNFCEICPQTEKFHIVEIDYEVVSTAKKYFNFKENNIIKVFIEDAFNFVKNAEDSYDLIVLDIAGGKGIPFCFITKEFISSAKNILTDKGIMLSHAFTAYNFNSDENYIFKSVLKTYKNIFSDTKLQSSYHLIATQVSEAGASKDYDQQFSGKAERLAVTAESNTLKAHSYNNIIIVPSIFGDRLFRKIFFDFEEKIYDTTSALLFSSKTNFDITPEKLVIKAKEFQKNKKHKELMFLDKFAEDMIKEEINTENFKIISDSEFQKAGINKNNFKESLRLT